MTQATPPVTDVQIRQAIAATLRNALVELHGAELGNQIRIHDHWLWGFSLGENIALLRVKEGTEKGKVHGWIIGLNAVSRNRPGQSTETSQGQYHLRKNNINRRDILRSYRVWCYHQLDTGESADNSENRLALEIESVSDAFSKNHLLGLTNEWFMGHEDLQFPLVEVFDFGDIQANVAQGSLGVRMQKPYDLTQY